MSRELTPEDQAAKAQRQQNVARAQELHREGMSYAKIATVLGVHATTVRGYVLDPDRKLGMTGRKKWADLKVIEYLSDPQWARQDGETKRAYEAFVAYRDTPYDERSYDKTTAMMGLSKNSVRVLEWSKRFRWQERLKAWDTHIEERVIRAQEQALEDMGARQAMIGMNLQLKALQRLMGDDEAGVVGINMNLVTAREVAVLAETGAKLERLALGAETERVDNQNKPIEIKLSFNPVPNLRDAMAGRSLPDVIDGEARELPELPPAA